jgi:energy-coupling factor transporter transmembrane protein EcfT
VQVFQHFGLLRAVNAPLSRGEYRPVAILSSISMICFVFFWPTYHRADHTSPEGIIIIVFLLIKFIFMRRRLRDAHWRTWLASPVPVLLFIHIFFTYWVPNNGVPWYIWPWNPSGIPGLDKMEAATAILCGSIFIADALLLTLPTSTKSWALETESTADLF